MLERVGYSRNNFHRISLEKQGGSVLQGSKRDSLGTSPFGI